MVKGMSNSSLFIRHLMEIEKQSRKQSIKFKEQGNNVLGNYFEGRGDGYEVALSAFITFYGEGDENERG